MSRKGSNFLDYGIEDEIDPKIKFNSLISVTVSTLMCLAAKCPLPKSNIETTRLFLSTITDDNGQTPKNIRGFVSLLDSYTGPFDSDGEKHDGEKTPRDKEKLLDECDSISNNSALQVITKDGVSAPESQLSVKKNTKPSSKRSEKDTKKTSKSLSSKQTPSKSLISKF